MHNLITIAHAGVEHGSEAEAAAHKSNSVMLIIVITAVTLIILTLLFRTLAKEKPKESAKDNKEKSKKT